MRKIKMDWSPVIAAVIAGAITIIGIRFGWKKDRASVVQIYEDLSAKQALRIAELQEYIEKVEQNYKTQQNRIVALEKRVGEYEAGIVLLITQLDANGIPPLWKPDSPKFAK